MSTLRSLVRDGPTNARLAWLLTAVAGLASVWVLLTGTALWGLIGLCVVLVVALPALVTGDWTVVVPWPLPACGLVAGVLWVGGLFPEAAGHLAIATLALVGTLELDVFTEVELSRRFAVAFAALSTLAVQALWTVAQFYSDRWLGTDLLGTQTELQWDIAVVTAVAVSMGLAFVWYLDRFSSAGSWAPLVPEEAS